MSLQTRLADLITAIGADISALQLAVTEVDAEIAFIFGPGTSSPAAQNVYNRIPGGANAMTPGADAYFRANAADGSVTILQTGWYYIDINILGPPAPSNRAGIFVGATDVTIANPLGGITFFVEAAGTSSGDALHVARITQLGAGNRLFPAVFNRNASANFQVLYMGIFKLAARGAQGIQGDRGDTGAVTGGPTRVSVLPSSPVNGEEVYFVADATAGVIWHLRYNSGSASPYKWEVVGGPPLQSEVVTSANETTSSTSFVALTTAGPSIALPLAGEYDIETSMLCWHSASNGACYMSYDIGATAAANADAAQGNAAVVNIGGFTPRRVRRKTIAAPVTLTAKYATSGATMTVGGTASVLGAHRRMSATPIRVG